MDTRRIPVRHDLAAEHLRGQVDVGKFVEGKLMAVGASMINLVRNANPDTNLATQLLYGEGFTVYDEITDMGLAWGQSERDGYVGYVPSAGLIEPLAGRIEQVSALSALVFNEPDFKSQLLGSYSLGCRVAVEGEENGYARLGKGIYTPLVNLAPVTGDFVSVAEKFIGSPYLWGGRSYFGLDCSGLVQLALQAVGVDAPRDSDMQEAELGAESDGKLRRGDLVFWDRHVGIMQNGENLLHANVHHMAVVSEPLSDVTARAACEITATRRL
jgi:hypothetical protein